MSIGFLKPRPPPAPPDVKQPSIVDALSKSKPAKRVPSFDSGDSDSDAKAPVTKAKQVKRKKVVSDDSDSSSGDLMSRLKAKTVTGKVGSPPPRGGPASTRLFIPAC